MRRALIVAGVWAGWVLLLGCCAAPLAGMALALLDTRQVVTEVVHVPHAGALLLYSLTVSVVGTGLALVLGIGPAAAIAPIRRGSGVRLGLTGLCIAPLLVPPQVYAYAWSLATAPDRLLAAALPAVSGVGAWGSAVRAGLISAGWLWPIVALVVAAGWRVTGQSVYALALLDTSPRRAFFRAVLPSLRVYLLAAACLVFTITLIEYPIPHLSLARTYATELLLLVDVGAPPGQVVRTALPALALVAGALVLAASLTARLDRWGAGDDEGLVAAERNRGRVWSRGAFAVVWIVSVVVPVGVMIGSLRLKAAWGQAFTLFQREWLTSLGVALATAIVSMLLALTTSVWGASRSGRGWGNAGAWLVGGVAMVPAAALGIGFITFYNRAGFLGDLYRDTPVVWVMALTARYAAIPVLIGWLTLRRRSIAAAEQARTDGAGTATIISEILLPMLWPALVAGGAIVGLLCLSEVVISQLVAPVGYPGIALAILGLMHYGRDDTVIVASLLIVAVGVLLAHVGSGLLDRQR